MEIAYTKTFLDENIRQWILSKWKRKWYHKYTPDELLKVAEDHNRAFWDDMERISRFQNDYPDAPGVPTFDEKGLTIKDLRAYIDNETAVVTESNSKVLNIGAENVDKALRERIDWKYQEKIPISLVLCALLGVLFEIGFLIMFGGNLFDKASFLGIAAVLLMWVAYAIGFVVIFVIIFEVANPVLNYITQLRYNRALIQMKELDSVYTRIREIKAAQASYERNLWAERSQKQTEKYLQSLNKRFNITHE